MNQELGHKIFIDLINVLVICHIKLHKADIRVNNKTLILQLVHNYLIHKIDPKSSERVLFNSVVLNQLKCVKSYSHTTEVQNTNLYTFSKDANVYEYLFTHFIGHCTLHRCYTYKTGGN